MRWLRSPRGTVTVRLDALCQSHAFEIGDHPPPPRARDLTIGTAIVRRNMVA